MMACLYRHIRKDLNVPFYIGIGVNIKRAYSATHRNAQWSFITNKTDYTVDILLDDIEYEYAKEKEKEFISLYKRKSDGGTLCNITLGGDGVLGLTHTLESRIKMSIPNKGKTISEEQKRKVSEFHKGKKVSDETRKKMSEAASNKKNVRYGVKVSGSTKEKMKASAKRGVENISSKLTDEDVINIRKIYLTGLGSRKIGVLFGVTKGTIMSIINKKTWCHI